MSSETAIYSETLLEEVLFYNKTTDLLNECCKAYLNKTKRTTNISAIDNK